MQEMEEDVPAVITKPAGASSYLFTTRRPSSTTLLAGGGGFWSAADLAAQPTDLADPEAARLLTNPAGTMKAAPSSAAEIELPRRKSRSLAGATARP